MKNACKFSANYAVKTIHLDYAIIYMHAHDNKLREWINFVQL